MARSKGLNHGVACIITEIRFSKLFPNIIEDEVDSSDDNDEKKKNERLERLGKIAAAPDKM